MLCCRIPVGLRRSRATLPRRIFIAVVLVASCLLSVEYFIWTCVLLATSKTFSVPVTSQPQTINSDVIYLGNTGDQENNTTPRTTIHGTAQQVHLGKLMVHIWFDLCGKNVDTLRRWPLFPFFPDTRSFISNFQTLQMNGSSNGQRTFGFIEPPRTCRYKFALFTALGCSSELWLSEDEDSTSSRLIAGVYDETTGANNKTHQTVTSRRLITLQAGKKYFIELLSIHDETNSHVSVGWSCVDVLKPAFEFISSQYISSYVDTERIPSHASKPTDRSESSRHVQLVHYDYFRLPFVIKEEYKSIPVCSYSPSFLIKRKLARYEGALKFLAFKTSKIFPQDDTDMKNRSREWTEPNLVAEGKLVQSVVNKFVSSLNSGKYFLKRIHKVIQKSDPPHGDRFFVDVEVGLVDTNQSYRLSEHVYQTTTNSSLCLPEGINWNSNATVYFILPVKNQGKWVHHFINQVSERSLLTGDTNFHVMVVDFDSQDIDLGKTFNTSLLRSRHTVIKKIGKFYKTLALNEAADRVPSPHDILFLFDLHIDVPADILDSVRKNTIEGHIAYLPVVGRLDCDSDSVEHRGFWQMNGYGVAAVYKSDWIRFGGMNSRVYKYEWGGEDWDLLDRVLSAQLEVERIKYPGLFHHHHAKQRSWN